MPPPPFPSMDIWSPRVSGRGKPWLYVYEGVRTKEDKCRVDVSGIFARSHNRCLQTLSDYRRNALVEPAHKRGHGLSTSSATKGYLSLRATIGKYESHDASDISQRDPSKQDFDAQSRTSAGTMKTRSAPDLSPSDGFTPRLFTPRSEIVPWDSFPTQRSMQPVSKKWLFRVKNPTKAGDGNHGSPQDRAGQDKMPPLTSTSKPTPRSGPTTRDSGPVLRPSNKETQSKPTPRPAPTPAVPVLRPDKKETQDKPTPRPGPTPAVPVLPPATKDTPDFLSLRSHIRRQASIPLVQRSNSSFVPWISLGHDPTQCQAEEQVTAEEKEPVENLLSFRLPLTVDVSGDR